MPTTRPGTFGGHYFDPDVFTGYVDERNPVKAELMISGALYNEPRIQAQIQTEGNVVTVPSYSPLNEDALNYNGLIDNVPVPIEGKKQTAMSYGRMRAWTDQDFTRELTGAQPLNNVAGKIANWKVRENQKVLNSILDGIFEVPEFADHTKDVSSADMTVGEGNKISLEAILDAKTAAFGDNIDMRGTLITHSIPYNELRKKNLVQFVMGVLASGMQVDPNVPFIGNDPILVDDTVTVEAAGTAAKKYHSYLLGAGSIATATGRVDTPNYVAYDPETKGGVNSLYTKWRFLMHPMGFSFNVNNIATESPTNEEYRDPANWSLVFDGRIIPLIRLITNG